MKKFLIISNKLWKESFPYLKGLLLVPREQRLALMWTWLKLDYTIHKNHYNRFIYKSRSLTRLGIQWTCFQRIGRYLFLLMWFLHESSTLNINQKIKIRFLDIQFLIRNLYNSFEKRKICKYLEEWRRVGRCGLWRHHFLSFSGISDAPQKIPFKPESYKRFSWNKRVCFARIAIANPEWFAIRSKSQDDLWSSKCQQ